MTPRLDISGSERANGTRIALTIGLIVVALVVALWGGAAVLGKLFSGPAVTPSASTTATSTPTPLVSAEPTEPADLIAEPEPTSSAPAPAPAATPAPKKKQPAAPSESLGVVVIDAGHQGSGDSKLEPIGPGASEKKPRVTSGTAGVATRKPEGKLTLEVALKLRDELEARGAKVVMVRTKMDVSISNRERAEIGNDAKADLVIRLHADGNTDRNMVGLSTLVPGKNQWTGPIVAESGAAGRIVHRAVIATTGAKDLGVVPRTDLSGFNWSTRPSVLVEMGFMSNAAEDRKLSTDAYQAQLVEGMANGVVEYLQSR